MRSHASRTGTRLSHQAAVQCAEQAIGRREAAGRVRRDLTVPALVSAPASTPLSGPPLPVPRPATVIRGSRLCYSLTTIDGHGRLGDRAAVRLLGWQPGQPLDITVNPHAAVIVANRGGAQSVNRRGHLWLPAAVRHVCGFEAGDRVLLAADRDRMTVVAYTMAALDAMILRWHATADAGPWQ